MEGVTMIGWQSEKLDFSRWMPSAREASDNFSDFFHPGPPVQTGNKFEFRIVSQSHFPDLKTFPPPSPHRCLPHLSPV